MMRASLSDLVAALLEPIRPVVERGLASAELASRRTPTCTRQAARSPPSLTRSAPPSAPTGTRLRTAIHRTLLLRPPQSGHTNRSTTPGADPRQARPALAEGPTEPVVAPPADKSRRRRIADFSQKEKAWRLGFKIAGTGVGISLKSIEEA